MAAPARRDGAPDHLADDLVGARVLRVRLGAAQVAVALQPRDGVARARRTPPPRGSIGFGAVRHHGDSTGRPRYGVTIRSMPASCHPLPELPPRGRAAVPEVEIDRRGDGEDLRRLHRAHSDDRTSESVKGPDARGTVADVAGRRLRLAIVAGVRRQPRGPRRTGRPLRHLAGRSTGSPRRPAASASPRAEPLPPLSPPASLLVGSRWLSAHVAARSICCSCPRLAARSRSRSAGRLGFRPWLSVALRAPLVCPVLLVYGLAPTVLVMTLLLIAAFTLTQFARVWRVRWASHSSRSSRIVYTRSSFQIEWLRWSLHASA